MLLNRLSLEAPHLPAGESPSVAPAPDELALEIRGLGPRRAIEICARALGPGVGRLCMGLLGSRPEAEEAAQETFLQAAAGLEGFRGEGTIRSWIFRIARRTCARRLETRARRQGRLVLAYEAGEGPARPDEEVEARDRGQIVRAALAELRPSEQEVILLRFDAGLPFREVALACGIDEATARKRASRALERLRELLPLEELR
ncbi:MAG: sigma-70 family RNA polymerase sigma factor [Deltaproteobacteria bacterium]|nr:sigma-70 family RNA polymerase sigma factor [Deltaproteobacteria bacterium]